MCGIAGIWFPGGCAPEAGHAAAAAMAAALAHRGPDGAGSWVDAAAGVALGHARLAILDRSPAGAQPMLSPSGRFVLVLNGEIYNHGALRVRLAAAGLAPRWRGGSDTETLLAAIDAWGLPRALERIEGMFALALWDRGARRLVLARDRIGEKPLAWGRAGRALVFGSELGALRAAPGFAAGIDQGALAGFLARGHVVEPASILEGVGKVPAGTLVDFGGPHETPPPLVHWSLEAAALRMEREPGGRRTIAERVERRLQEVVASQLQADVPVGCFLSGGIDSSLVAALARRAGGPDLRSFSVGVRAPGLDESADARQVAAHLGTRHVEIPLGEAEAAAVVPDLAAVHDEPFADSSQIPTLVLARAARREVGVALTGDGGDEIFGGYTRHVAASLAWRLPWPLRRVAAQALAHAPLAAAAARLAGVPPSGAARLSSLAGALAAEDIAALHRALASPGGAGAARLLPPGSGLADPGAAALAACAGRDASAAILAARGPAAWMMAADTLGYLPGDILVKVDRAAMSTGLETRAPFLDRRVVELAWRLPDRARVAGRTGKRVLRDILARHLPPALKARPKQGFAVPLGAWLRGGLRPWAEAGIASAATRGILDGAEVRALWAGHLAGAEDRAALVWHVLMLEGWCAQADACARGAGPAERSAAPHAAALHTTASCAAGPGAAGPGAAAPHTAAREAAGRDAAAPRLAATGG